VSAPCRILALTVIQPWADLIVRGPKRVDLDHWEAAAETAMTLDLSLLRAFDDQCTDDRKLRAWASKAVPYSAVVGVARLAGIERAAPDSDPWWCGPVGWRLDNVVAIDPIPCAGAQGLWALDPATLEAVRAAWKAVRAAKETR